MTHKLDKMAFTVEQDISVVLQYNNCVFTTIRLNAKYIILEALEQAYNQAIEDAKNAIKSKQIQLHEQTRSYVVDVLDQLKKETK